MHSNKFKNNTFAPEKNKHVKFNDFTSNPIGQKNFISGLQNARRLLEGLERSFAKTVQYEARLLRCQATHAHSHDDRWSSDNMSYEKDYRTNNTESTKTSRGQVDLAESWSTMSIVCLQYQYEELSKRYEALLRAYDERCSVVSERDAALTRSRVRARNTHAQLVHAHKTLLAVGEKYLALWQKKHLQKKKFEKYTERLKATVRGMIAMCEHARLELDTRISRFMEKEQDAPKAQLLAEIRKCNLLYLENLRLKSQLESLKPGLVFMRKT
ncbi:unnamed protein product [Chilo suppressalis]|uniref:Uncharacterized protein n=1 Tax=Chilo suppressalis TaxID=168631 RepID=A0ABN8ASP9_CHISP|nr:hypothetical protein evm_004632 [Chilo suppressalis]CAH0398838.1 unnamed protein product [Chilo suppressalis]